MVDDAGGRGPARRGARRRSRVGVTGELPADRVSSGVVDGMLVDRAFGEGDLLPGRRGPSGRRHNVTNALAAAALALAAGVDAVRGRRAGLRDFRPGGHRNVRVASVGGVD